MTRFACRLLVVLVTLGISAACNRGSSTETSAAPRVAFVITVAALLGVLILAQKAGQTEQPPEPSAFVPPEGPTYLAFDVEAVSGGKVRLASGSGLETDATEVEFPAGTRIWRMEPATAAELTPPLVVNAVSVPNDTLTVSE